MQVFDASSMIYAWDNYPIGQFPPLWDWMATKIAEKILVMPCVAFEEVEHKTPECADWLKANGIRQLQVTDRITKEAIRLKDLVGIEGDKYSSKGVDENDLLIIATAKAHGATLVTDEEKQTTPPKNPVNSKIPAVCVMRLVSVDCVNFLEFIKSSGEVFR